MALGLPMVTALLVGDGRAVVASVSADAWRHATVKDTGTRVHVLFTDPSGTEVLVEGWLNSKGVLKTKVIES